VLIAWGAGQLACYRPAALDHPAGQAPHVINDRETFLVRLGALAIYMYNACPFNTHVTSHHIPVHSKTQALRIRSLGL